LVFILIILFETILFAQENNSPGRSFPGSIWQARNNCSSISETPQEATNNPFNISTIWGTDQRLSYTEVERIHNPEIAARGNYVYVAWWNVHDNQLDLARSTNLGQTWEPQQRISDNSGGYVGLPQIAVWDSCVYVIYTTGASWVWITKSTDYGQTWQRVNIYETARNWGGGPTIVTRANRLYSIFSILVDYVPPQDQDLYLYRSNDFGESWSDTFYVSDSTYSGIGPDMAINCLARQPDPYLHIIREIGIATNTQEVFYQRSSDGGESWSPLLIISDNDSIHSFWPQIAAWGDSSIIATWVDYKFSSQEWTGDAFISRSTNNGLTWSNPAAMTSNHMVSSSDIYASGDTVALTYEEGPIGGPEEVFANISHDGGLSWLGESLVNDEVNTERMEPCVAISGGYAHVAWSDGRDRELTGQLEAYYNRGYIDSASEGVKWDNKDNMPDQISLSAYPNPFNSSCIISYNLKDEKRGELFIYDIQGKKIRGYDLSRKEGKIIWDARDAMGNKISSGIYFARAVNNDKGANIKLIYLK
jgi:hypothetical protein